MTRKLGDGERLQNRIDKRVARMIADNEQLAKVRPALKVFVELDLRCEAMSESEPTAVYLQLVSERRQALKFLQPYFPPPPDKDEFDDFADEDDEFSGRDRYRVN
jgi:hypothetical protein